MPMENFDIFVEDDQDSDVPIEHVDFSDTEVDSAEPQYNNWPCRVLPSTEDSRYYRAFDTILFSGYLRKARCRVVFGNNFTGLVQGVTGGIARKRGYTVIYIFKRPEIAWEKERLRIYLIVLLHEMIHALIREYACGCFRCVRCHVEGSGHTGHGYTWQLIAAEVEKTTRLRLGLELDLLRGQSLEYELNAGDLELQTARMFYPAEELGLLIQIIEGSYYVFNYHVID
ncbi:hypothetical protein CJF32_00004883 [Rutstroemia sp. NJR-2017a WRK4]|nr:hypothetical protein CJF32_00004883 [Rutstroemia sp. NJR-2017a WRK4]